MIKIDFLLYILISSVFTLTFCTIYYRYIKEKSKLKLKFFLMFFKKKEVKHYIFFSLIFNILLIYCFYQENVISNILEIALFNLFFLVSMMDIKTMTIDGKLSIIIIFIAILNLGYSKGIKITSWDLMMILLLISAVVVVIYFFWKKKKRTIIGIADIELIVAMIFYFHELYISFFISLCGIMGILYGLCFSKILQKRKIQEMPFIPSITIAFYLLRFFLDQS